MDVNKIISIIGNHDGDAVDLAKSLGGALEKRRAKTAKKRAGGQELPPSKYMPNVPRAVHAEGGKIAAPPAAMHEPHRRAEEQGYSIKGYHVTKGRHANAISSASRFDPDMSMAPGERAVFFWDNPDAANEWTHHTVGVDPDSHEEYSERENDRMDRYAPTIMPVRIHHGKHLEVNWPEETGQHYYDNRSMAKVIRQARSEGYDTVRIKNMIEGGITSDEDIENGYKPHDQIAVLNPAMIRSEFAEFDPNKQGRDDIGAANGGAIEDDKPQYKTWHDVPTINPQDLVGKKVFPIFADLTKAGEDFKGIDSVQIAHPEKLMGGPGYPLLPESQQHGLGWAVEGKGRGSAKIRKDADYVVVSAMEPFSHQSNATFANSLTKNMLAYAANGRISKKDLKKLDAMVRKESEQKELQGLQNFPGFQHPDAEDFIRNASFEQRSRIADIIGSREAQDMGAPNMEKLTRATLDPEFAGVPSRHVLFLLEIPKGSEDEQLVNLKESGLPEHPSYKYGIKGRVVGRFAHPVSPEVLFKDWFDQKKAEQKEGKTNIRRAFDLAMPVTTISQEVADMLPKDAKDIQSGRAAKLALNAFNDQWHDTETPVKQGGLGPAQMSHALKNSDMSSTLSQYTPEEIKKMQKEGKFTGYKLKDGEIYFGLKRGMNYADEYGFEHPDLTDNETALVSVVNNEPGARGIGGAPVVLKAIQHGATALDAFAVPTDKHPNGFLPDFYSNFGFEELGRIPFDPKYVTKDQFDDMKHEWSKTGWDEQKHGLPSISIMKWRGNEDDRSDAIRRHVTKGSEGDRAGAHPVNVSGAAGAPERGPDAGLEPAQGGRELGDVGRDLGTVRDDRGPRPADRFTRTLTAAAQLNPTEAQHFGITPEDIAPAKRAFGFASGGSIDIKRALEVSHREGKNFPIKDLVNNSLDPAKEYQKKTGKIHPDLKFTEKVDGTKERMSAMRANVPVRWSSSPDHASAHLAYITDEEAELLKNADLHNSNIAHEHHVGPGGVPSYQGGGIGSGGSTNTSGGPGSAPGGDGSKSGSSGMGAGTGNVSSNKGTSGNSNIGGGGGGGGGGNKSSSSNKTYASKTNAAAEANQTSGGNKITYNTSTSGDSRDSSSSNQNPSYSSPSNVGDDYVKYAVTPDLSIGGPQGMTGAAAFGRPEQGTNTYNLDNQPPMTVNGSFTSNIGSDYVKDVVSPDLGTANSPFASGVQSYDRAALDIINDRMRGNQAELRDAAVERTIDKAFPEVPNAGDLYGATNAPLAVNQQNQTSGMYGQPQNGTTTFGTGIRPAGFPSQQTGVEDPAHAAYQEQMAKTARQAWLDANTEPESPRMGDLPTPHYNRPYATPDRAGSIGSMPSGTQKYSPNLMPLSSRPAQPITPTPFSGYPQDVQKQLITNRSDESFGKTMIDPSGEYTSEALKNMKLAEDALAMLNSPTLAGAAMRAVAYLTKGIPNATPQQQAEAERVYRQTYGNGSSSGQSVRDNFNDAFSDARARGDSTFSWTNPKTGQTGTYTTKIKASGGSVGYDPESILRHALAVAFRYGS